jgi:hypothetical protein
MNVGDDVALLAHVLTSEGRVLDPKTTPKGTVIGFRGHAAVVSWHTTPPETSICQPMELRVLTVARRKPLDL